MVRSPASRSDRRAAPSVPAHRDRISSKIMADKVSTSTPRGVSRASLRRRLGISKQAAGKTIDRLEELGYVRRSGDDADRRRKLARLTPRGVEVLALSAMIFEDIRSRWAGTLGAGRLAELESGLRTMVPGETFRLDVPGWFGA